MNYKKELEFIVNGLLFEAVRQGLTIKDLAARAKLHPNTIHYINTGKTRFPYLKTILKMAYALGVKLHLDIRAQKRRAG